MAFYNSMEYYIVIRQGDVRHTSNALNPHREWHKRQLLSAAFPFINCGCQTTHIFREKPFTMAWKTAGNKLFSFVRSLTEKCECWLVYESHLRTNKAYDEENEKNFHLHRRLIVLSRTLRWWARKAIHGSISNRAQPSSWLSKNIMRYKLCPKIGIQWRNNEMNK